MSSMFLMAAPNARSAQDLVGDSYLKPDPAVVQRFLKANSFTKPSERLMRGEVGSIVDGSVGESVGKSVWGDWGNDIYTTGEDAFAVLRKRLAD